MQCWSSFLPWVEGEERRPYLGITPARLAGRRSCRTSAPDRDPALLRNSMLQARALESVRWIHLSRALVVAMLIAAEGATTS